MCNNPGGGGKPGWWKIGKGIALPGSKCVVGLPTAGGGGGGSVKAFRGWCGGTNKPGLKWNEPLETDVSFSGDEVMCDSGKFGEWWICVEDCWIFGFRGPLSCWTAETIKLL